MRNNKIEALKYEVASEIGFDNYARMDKGNLTSRENGMVGGLMVRRMIENYKRG